MYFSSKYDLVSYGTHWKYVDFGFVFDILLLDICKIYCMCVSIAE